MKRPTDLAVFCAGAGERADVVRRLHGGLAYTSCVRCPKCGRHLSPTGHESADRRRAVPRHKPEAR